MDHESGLGRGLCLGLVAPLCSTADTTISVQCLSFCYCFPEDMEASPAKADGCETAKDEGDTQLKEDAQQQDGAQQEGNATKGMEVDGAEKEGAEEEKAGSDGGKEREGEGSPKAEEEETKEEEDMETDGPPEDRGVSGQEKGGKEEEKQVPVDDAADQKPEDSTKAGTVLLRCLSLYLM